MAPTKITTDINKSAANAIQVISEAAHNATNTIAEAALNASKLLASNAADAAKRASVITSADHDSITMLIATVGHLNDRLTEKFDDLKCDIKDLKDGTANKINDHTTRINALEKMDLGTRIEKIEGGNMWLTRLVIGAVILAGLGLVLIK
jgi:hypothetical protein